MHFTPWIGQWNENRQTQSRLVARGNFRLSNFCFLDWRAFMIILPQIVAIAYYSTHHKLSLSSFLRITIILEKESKTQPVITSDEPMNKGDDHESDE